MCVVLHNIHTTVTVLFYVNQHAKVKTRSLNILNSIRIKYLEGSHSEKKKFYKIRNLNLLFYEKAQLWSC